MRPSPPPAFPPLAIHFTGEVSGSLHSHQFGHFTLTNLSGRPLHWSRSHVEAPTDPALHISEMFDSNVEHGKLAPQTSATFRALVPNTNGAPFRLLISCTYAPDRLDPLKDQLARDLPWAYRFFAVTNRSEVFTSQWFYASADYSHSTNIPSVP